MKLGEWSGAAVEMTAGGAPPASAEWRPVDVPGSPQAFAGEACVAYRTRFDDPRRGDQTRALLTLRGLYARARVWMNGELLGTHDTYFVPARFLFEPEPDNELVVECRPPDDRFGGVHDSEWVPPESRVPGIWWGAEVEGLSPVAITDVAVRPRIGGETASFDVAVEVDATREVDDSVTFSLRPEGFRGGGMMERAPVSTTAGERVTVERTIEVRDPRPWYPQGYGPQHRYILRAKVADREVTVPTGLSTVAYTDDGIAVNGVNVRARGFDLLPSPDPAADVERAVEANANFVRVHAHVPPASLHRACDEAGLLVWQDLPLTGEGGYDIDRGRTLARALARRVGNHPCVGIYGVHDDPRELFPSPIGGGRSGRTRLRWRAWRASYNHGPDEAVAEAFPDDHPVFAVSGPVGIDPDAAHLYPGWDYGAAGDVEWLLARNPDLGRVVTEFGAGALAGGDVEEAAGFDRKKHDARVGDGVEASQAYQAATLKTVAEALRRHDAHAMAAFALRDTDAAGMGVLSRDGTPKAGYEAIAASFAPVQAVLDAPPAATTIGTTVLNDTPEPVSGTLSWQAGEREGSGEVAADPHARADGPEVSVPGEAAEVVLSLSLGDRTVENRYRLSATHG